MKFNSTLQEAYPKDVQSLSVTGSTVNKVLNDFYSTRESLMFKVDEASKLFAALENSPVRDSAHVISQIEHFLNKLLEVQG